MKMIHPITAIALPALLIGHGIANAAATNGAAVEACAGAIAVYIEDRQGVEPGLQVDQSGVASRGRLSRLTAFEMDAYDASSENVVGRFTCFVNRRAQVRKLVPLPLTAPDAEERGRG